MPFHGGVLSSVLLSPPSPEAVRRAVDEVYRDGGLQRSLPGPDAPPGDALDLGDWSVLGEALLWTGAAVVAVLAAVWLFREVSARGRRAALPAAPGGAAPPDASILRAPLEAAEALAAEGRWADAIHALLLRTLETLVVTTGSVLPPALTSRDIQGRVPLADRARAALGDLVLAVEVSRFGGAAAGPEDYARCLARFREFAAAYGRAA